MKNRAAKIRGNPCRVCRETLRYRSNGACVACATSPKRNAERRAYSETPEAKALEVARLQKRHTTPDGIVKLMLYSAKKRAKGRFAFDLDPAAIELRVRAGRCEATGLPFDLSPNDGSTRTRPFAPAIDRVNNSKGYTFDNIRIVCNIYNLAKNDFSESDLLAMAVALAERCNIS